jgi:RNA polymerase sigma factor for flagellar operon FliA
MISESMYPSSNSTNRPALSNELARRYTPRIRRHAARVARRLPRHVAMADLVSAGYAGLVDAFVRFDTSRMDSFEAYIDHRIRGAILDELRDHDPLTRDQRAFARRLATATHQLAVKLGRAPEEAEIAASLEMSLSALQSQLSRMNATAARSGAAVYDEETVESVSEDAERPDAQAERSERRALVGAAMDQLPARQRKVLQMYYEEGQTLRQIADSLGVTESRVSQIHSEAINKLRTMVTES